LANGAVQVPRPVVPGVRPRKIPCETFLPVSQRTCLDTSGGITNHRKEFAKRCFFILTGGRTKRWGMAQPSTKGQLQLHVSPLGKVTKAGPKKGKIARRDA